MIASIISMAAVAVLTAADQLIKLAVERGLQPIGSKSFIDGFIGWRYVRNTGAAFGSFSNSTVLLSVFTAIVLIALIVYVFSGKIKSKFCLVTVTMIIAGGAGNLIDRIFRGYVVDFIEVQFTDFAVFNFADILVTCGAFMLIGYLIYDTVKDYRAKKAGNGNG